MANLLDRASVVLTPTAYNNGEALCIKPDDASGDFTFSRNSAATRVNAQGLVENVQSLGSELVTNGNFDTDSDWTKGTGWSISGGTANCDGTQTSSTVMNQSSVTNSNTNVKVSFTISGYVSGLIRVRNSGGFAGTYVSGNGTYVFYTNTGIATNIVLDADAAFTGSIDNVSVKEVIDNTNLPRINYEGFSYDGSGNVVPDSGCGSWLFEPQSTNLIPYSEDYNSGNWFEYNETSATIDASQSNPSGANGSYKIESLSGLGRFGLSAITVAPSTNYTLSFYVKNINATLLKVILGSGASPGSYTYTSEVNTSNWSRVSVNFTTGAVTSMQIQFLRDLPIGESAYIWGAMLEQNSFSTSYIPTEGSTVTRNQDLCTNAVV